MKFWVLTENTACREDLKAEHGLSLYLEVNGKKVLFDMGETDAFWNNAEKMGLDLTKVELAAVSHSHSDHCGGLGRFLQGNEKAPVYVSCHAFEQIYNDQNRNISMDPGLKDNPRLRFVEARQEIGPGLTLISCHGWERKYPLDVAGLQRMEDGHLVPDDFRHEQYLLIEEEGKKILISGCSHRGILNIMEWFRPDVLIGGFHFMKMDPDGEQVRHAAGELMIYPTLYYTGHCTGKAQLARMKEIMGEKLQAIATGFAGRI